MTIARFPLAVAFATVLLSFEQATSILILCATLLILMELTDVLDGMLARRTGVVTEWGATLDPYLDSISRITVYWALAYRGLAMAIVPLVMACRDVTVAYCRVILARSGRTVSARRSGKIKGQFQSVGAVLLLLRPLFSWAYTRKWTMHTLSWIIVVVTLASVIEYVADAFSASKAVKRELR